MARKRIEDLDRNFKTSQSTSEQNLRWYKIPNRKFQLKGLGWKEENGSTFHRLPDRAEKIVREPVWLLSLSPASVHLHFRTDSGSLAIKAANSAPDNFPHMAPTGKRGLSLYCGAPYVSRPWKSGIPLVDSPVFEQIMFEGLEKKMREFRLYLPLYQELVSLQIGLEPGSRIVAPSPMALKKPVVFYGTSVTQGGCSSTAGDDFVSTVGRTLNIETINLGFSGNGRGEPEVTELISEIDAAMYVLDYGANTNADGMKKTLPKFCSILRKKRPDTPIMLISRVASWTTFYQKEQWQLCEEQRLNMMEVFVKLRKKGDENLYFVDGWSLLPFGADGAFVDGVHPTSHGFAMMAERLAPFIGQVLFNDFGI